MSKAFIDQCKGSFAKVQTRHSLTWSKALFLVVLLPSICLPAVSPSRVSSSALSAVAVANPAHLRLLEPEVLNPAEQESKFRQKRQTFDDALNGEGPLGGSSKLSQFLSQFVLVRTPKGYILQRSERMDPQPRKRPFPNENERNFQLRVRKKNSSPFSQERNFQLRVRRPFPSAEKNFQLRVRKAYYQPGERNFQLRVRKPFPTAEHNFQLRVRKRGAAENFQLRVRKSPERHFQLRVRRPFPNAENNFQLRVRKAPSPAEGNFQLRVRKDYPNAEKNFQLRIRKGFPMAENNFQLRVRKSFPSPENNFQLRVRKAEASMFPDKQASSLEDVLQSRPSSRLQALEEAYSNWQNGDQSQWADERPQDVEDEGQQPIREGDEVADNEEE